MFNHLCNCYAAIIGRILLGGFFLWAGIQKATAFAGTAGYIASAGLPMPTAAAALAVAIEVGLGLALIMGFRVRLAALLLAVFTIVVTVIFHSNFSDQMQVALFLKNVAIIGGLLYMSAYPSGRWPESKTS